MSNITAFGTFSKEASSSTRDAMKTGSAQWIKFALGEPRIIRILPPLADEELPWVIIHQHFIKLAGQDTIIFNCPRLMSNSRCPACEKRDRLLASGKPGDDKLAREFKPSTRAIARAIARGDAKAGVQPVGLSSTVMKRLSYFREKLGKDFTHPEDGYDIAVERLDEAPWYNVDLTDSCAIARTDEGMEDIIEKMRALPLASFGKVLEYDDIIAKFSGQPQVAARPAPALSHVNGSSDPF